MVCRSDPEVAERYAKDPEVEWFLERLNASLQELERDLERTDEIRSPTGFVVGVPRSGTTLLTQVLTSTLDLGYVDHIVAAFWRAPVVGIRLSAKLISGERRSSFASEFGRTNELSEPHEFGYFWSERLNYVEPVEKTAAEAEAIDWEGLRRTLGAMSNAFAKPAIYKTFHLGWHMERVARLISKSLFLWIRRPPLDSALSLLKMRREFLGSEEKWASLRPQGYEDMQERSPAEQVAAQVHALEISFARQAASIPARQRLVLTYSNLCRNPSRVVEAVRDALDELGQRPVPKVEAPPPFEVREPMRNEEAEVVREALSRWYDSPEDVGLWTDLAKETGRP